MDFQGFPLKGFSKFTENYINPFKTIGMPKGPALGIAMLIVGWATPSKAISTLRHSGLECSRRGFSLASRTMDRHALGLFDTSYI